MKDRYRLHRLGNQELLAALSTLVQSESALLSDLLAHLAELDERRLFVELGYASLFAYCTEALGLCKSSAGRRIAAARVCRRHPDAFERVARGELQLSVLCALGPHLNQDNAPELFEACSRRSCEQVEELLAARFPKPDVRDLIRRLPVRSSAATSDVVDIGSSLQVTDDAQTGIGGVSPEVKAHSASCAELKGAAPPPGARGTIEPLSADRFGVHFTADTEFRELLAEVRALASHRCPSRDLMTLMKRGLEAYRRELQKERFALGRSPRRQIGRDLNASRGAPSTRERRTRHVPAAVAREVYLRDGGRCTFVAADGHACGLRDFLELDHEKPWAQGGESIVKNLRLRCRAHNQLAARDHFGAAYMRAALKRAQ